MEINDHEFAKLVRKYQSTISSVCFMYASDKEEVDSLVQEALIRIWQGLPKFNGDSDLKTWIWRVTINSCLNVIAKEKREKEKEKDFGDMLDTSSPEDSQQMEVLHNRIRQLKPFDRAIILLWLEDMSYDEIGQIVGISVKNVSMRLVRIREQLKKMN